MRMLSVLALLLLGTAAKAQSPDSVFYAAYPAVAATMAQFYTTPAAVAVASFNARHPEVWAAFRRFYAIPLAPGQNADSALTMFYDQNPTVLATLRQFYAENPTIEPALRAFRAEHPEVKEALQQFYITHPELAQRVRRP